MHVPIPSPIRIFGKDDNDTLQVCSHQESCIDTCSTNEGVGGSGAWTPAEIFVGGGGGMSKKGPP